MRKVEFRKQITKKDCVPTSFINAMIYLFGMQEGIPNEIVQGIYLKTINNSDGTSGQEIKNLCHWLSNYRNSRYKNFSVKAIYKDGEDVDFDELKKYVKKANSCALLSVKADNKKDGALHYITLIRYEDGYFYCFDPYYVQGRKEDKKGNELWSLGIFEECNLKISIDFLKRKGKKQKYQSEKDEQECVLIERIDK